jgi:hypothetical protein
MRPLLLDQLTTVLGAGSRLLVSDVIAEVRPTALCRQPADD